MRHIRVMVLLVMVPHSLGNSIEKLPWRRVALSAVSRPCLGRVRKMLENSGNEGRWDKRIGSSPYAIMWQEYHAISFVLRRILRGENVT
jgi:hypothetical protein